MAIYFPDILRHNNPLSGLIDSDFVRGGKRAVATTTDMYNLYASQSDQMKVNVTTVRVTSTNQEFVLTDTANASNSAGWTLSTDLSNYMPLNPPGNFVPVLVNLTNTNNGRSQATRQVIFGYKDPTSGLAVAPTDSTNAIRTPPVQILSRRDSGSDQPGYLYMGCPDITRPNGFWFQGRNHGTAASPSNAILSRMVVRSTTGSQSTLDFPGCALELKCIGDEYMSVSNQPSVGVRIVCSKVNPAQPNRFDSLSAVPYTDYRTRLFEIAKEEPYLGGYGSNFASLSWYIRTNNDMHKNGTEYIAGLNYTANTTVDLTKEVYQFTGGTGVTLTLPDPTDADNLGRTHYLVNNGTAALTLSRAVYQDATTPITSLGYAAPDNKMRIYCDGTRWIVISM